METKKIKVEDYKQGVELISQGYNLYVKGISRMLDKNLLEEALLYSSEGVFAFPKKKRTFIGRKEAEKRIGLLNEIRTNDYDTWEHVFEPSLIAVMELSKDRSWTTEKLKEMAEEAKETNRNRR